MCKWLGQLSEKVKSAEVDWVKGKATEVATNESVNLITKMGKTIVDCEGILIIIALVGIYFTLANNKKLGTKLTSASILIYLLGVLLSHVS